MTAQTVSSARRRWACVCGTLAIVAAYVAYVAHAGLPTIPAHVAVALVAVLTWAAVGEVQDRQVVATRASEDRGRGSVAMTRS